MVQHLNYKFPYPEGIASDYKRKYLRNDNVTPAKKFNIEIEKRYE